MTLPIGALDPVRVGGGDINEAWHVQLDGEDAFVKTRPDAGEGEYALEAAGLKWLAEPGALRTPAVIEVAEDYLALEWVESGVLSAEGAEELGRGLAATTRRARRALVIPASASSSESKLASALCACRTIQAKIGRRFMLSVVCWRWPGSRANEAP